MNVIVKATKSEANFRLVQLLRTDKYKNICHKHESLI